MDSVSLSSGGSGSSSGSGGSSDRGSSSGSGSGRRSRQQFYPQNSDGSSLTLATSSESGSSSISSLGNISSDSSSGGRLGMGRGRGRSSGSGSSSSPKPTLNEPVVLMTEQELVLKHCGNQLAFFDSNEDADVTTIPAQAVIKMPAQSAVKTLGTAGQKPEMGINTFRSKPDVKSDKESSFVAMKKQIESATETFEIAGEQPEMETNYLRLKVNDDHPGVVEYHVTITPHISSIKQRRTLLCTGDSKEILGGNKHFDGETLLLPYFLPHDMSYETSLKEDQSALYKVCVTFTRIRPVRECGQFFLDLLRLSLRRLKYREMDGIFCDVNMRKVLDQHRVEIWPGISLKTEIKEDEMMFKVGTRNAFFGQDTVLDYLSKLKGTPSQVESKLDRLIMNMKVFTKYDFKCYVIDRVTWGITPESKFWNSDEVISFKEYIERKHKVAITNVGPPMLISIGKRPDDELGVRYVTLMPECCHITGLTDVLKGNEKLMADVLETVKLLDEQRLENVNTFFNRILGDVNVARFLDIWGLHLERHVQ